MGRFRPIIDARRHPRWRGPATARGASGAEGGAAGLAAAAVRALTKASRACLLYDFDNEAVADFLGELQECVGRALLHGPLSLEVRPWELRSADEVIYQETDRERSLAFRLYNDGVRTLTIHPAVTWEEITRLVGILSIRYSEVRQQEEDVVTMLWKASFEHIAIQAVDSYTPVDDEAPAAGAPRLPARLRQDLGADYEFDAPWPELRKAAEITHRPVAEEELERLRAEDHPSTLPDGCLRLTSLLLAAAAHPEDPLELPLVTPLVREMRDFLLGEGDDQALLEAVRVIHRAARALPDSPERTALLGVFIERGAFARMLDAAIAAESAPEALLELVSTAGVDELEVVLQLLASRWSGAGRELGRTIVRDGIGPRLRLVADQVLGLAPTVVGDILDVVVERDPELATVVASALLRRRDREARLEALTALERLPYRSEVGRTLTDQALADSDLEICGRAAEILAANGERRAAAAIRRTLERGLAARGTVAELGPLAAAAARLDPPAALELFAGWVGGSRPRSRGADPREWQLAVCGLALIPGEEAARLLALIHARSDGDLKTRCVPAIARQREISGDR